MEWWRGGLEWFSFWQWRAGKAVRHWLGCVVDGVGEKIAVCALINKKINVFGLGTKKLGRCKWNQHESRGSYDIALV